MTEKKTPQLDLVFDWIRTEFATLLEREQERKPDLSALHLLLSALVKGVQYMDANPPEWADSARRLTLIPGGGSPGQQSPAPELAPVAEAPEDDAPKAPDRMGPILARLDRVIEARRKARRKVRKLDLWHECLEAGVGQLERELNLPASANR